jgi:hypothetical protein
VNKLEPLAWILGSTAFVFLLGWICVRSVRWAKKRTTAADVLGLAINLPASGINPQPLPQERLEEMKNEISLRQDHGGADPKR